jgi:hypothetical protein
VDPVEDRLFRVANLPIRSAAVQSLASGDRDRIGPFDSSTEAIMAAVSLVIFCLLVGVLLRWSGRLPDDAPAALNGYVINVALPALALLHLHRAPLTLDFVTAAGGAADAGLRGGILRARRAALRPGER